MTDLNIGLVTQHHCCALQGPTTLPTQSLLLDYTDLGVITRSMLGDDATCSLESVNNAGQKQCDWLFRSGRSRFSVSDTQQMHCRQTHRFYLSFRCMEVLVQSQTLKEDLESLVYLTHFMKRHCFSEDSLMSRRTTAVKSSENIIICI